MATLERRLLALEKSTSTAPLVVMCIDGTPTTAQQSEIDRSARTGQRLFVYDSGTSAAWMPGCGVPWEGHHANH